MRKFNSHYLTQLFYIKTWRIKFVLQLTTLRLKQRLWTGRTLWISISQIWKMWFWISCKGCSRQFQLSPLKIREQFFDVPRKTIPESLKRGVVSTKFFFHKSVLTNPAVSVILSNYYLTNIIPHELEYI